MGKRKQFKARDKSTQRMTRDGLVTENQSTGEIHRVSTRSADFQLHHETAVSQDFSHHRKESQFNSAGSGNRPFHPAQTGNHRAIHSDFHDSHTLYPEMTSAEPISPISQNIIAPVDSLQNIENEEPLQFEESLHPQTILRQSVYEEPEMSASDSTWTENGNWQTQQADHTPVPNRIQHKTFQKQTTAAHDFHPSGHIPDSQSSTQLDASYEQDASHEPDTIPPYEETTFFKAEEYSGVPEVISQPDQGNSFSPYVHALAETHNHRQPESYRSFFEEQTASEAYHADQVPEPSRQETTASKGQPSDFNYHESVRKTADSPVPSTGSKQHSESIRKRANSFDPPALKTELQSPIEPPPLSYQEDTSGPVSAPAQCSEHFTEPLHTAYRGNSNPDFTEFHADLQDNGVSLNHRTERNLPLLNKKPFRSSQIPELTDQSANWSSREHVQNLSSGTVGRRMNQSHMPSASQNSVPIENIPQNSSILPINLPAEKHPDSNRIEQHHRHSKSFTETADPNASFQDTKNLDAFNIVDSGKKQNSSGKDSISQVPFCNAKQSGISQRGNAEKAPHTKQPVSFKNTDVSSSDAVSAEKPFYPLKDNGIDLNHRQEKNKQQSQTDHHFDLADKRISDTKAEPAKKKKQAARKTDRQQLHASESPEQLFKAGREEMAPDSEIEEKIPSRNRPSKTQNGEKSVNKSTNSKKESPKSKFRQVESEESPTNPGEKKKNFKTKSVKKGSASHLKFEDSDLTGRSGIVGSINSKARKIANTAALSGSAYIHGKIHEVEHENSAVEGTHKAEILTEKGIRELRNYQKGHSQSKRQKKKASRLQESSRGENPTFHPGTPVPKQVENNKSSLMNRFYQKLQNKRKASETAMAAKQGKKAGEKTVSTTGTIIEKAIVKVKDIFVNHKHTVYVILALLLVLILLLSQLQSCSVMITQSLGAITASSWPTDDEEITAADLYYTQLEANLQHKVNTIESTYPNYDEYNYNIGEIGHDPVVLISYLCAKYGSFKANDVKNELDTLFALQYHLNVETKSEQRTVTKTVRAGESIGMVVTSGYCNCSICCGQWAGGPTASGVYPTANHTIAVDASNPTVPMGTELIMNDTLYKVEDTGAFDQYGVDFDVYYDDHSAASAHGHQAWEAFYAGGDGEEIQVTTTETVRVCNVTLTTSNLQNLIANRLNSDQQELYQIYVSTRGNRQFLGTPLNCNWYGNVSSYYGYRTSPTTGEIQLHRGLDIAVPQGTEILAVQDGTVKTVAYDSSYGNYVVLENSRGYTTKYAHCSAVTVSAGQTVSTGDVIAKVGSTGNSTGPHLHIEFLYKGDYYNPYFYLGVGSGTLPGGGVITEFPGDVDALSDAQFSALIHEAEKYLGMAYVWGGSSPSTGFDCSGFVSYVFTNSGVYNMGRRTAQGIYDICTPVSPTDAKPGDIIFFTGTYNSGCPVSHVGIYVSNGQMIHCGDPIQYTSINTSYWQNHFYAFGRVGG